MYPEHLPSYVNLANLQMLESLYEKWLEDPQSVDSSWRSFFEGMQFASHLPTAFPPRQESADLRIYNLIQAYRTYGHLMAHCDVLQTEKPSLPKELQLENFGLSEKDLDTSFPTIGFIDKKTAPLKEILSALQKTYSQTIGIEYIDLVPSDVAKWIQKKIEPFFPSHLSNEDRLGILQELNQAEGFETFLHTKYVGQKRFSLEGVETFIPMLHTILRRGEDLGIETVVLGMAHRGRLNVLANILGKSYAYIFEEFEDYYTPDLTESTGDVKYHMGFSGTYVTKKGKKIPVILSANPSHLESVNPVVEGGVRALQELRSKEKQKEIVPILVHGDASIAGQGVVYETMTLSRLNGYGTKGTVHIVINNQIGFTTYSKDGRSTQYCTDIARAFGAPILHVNGEDPEACVTAGNIAIELRQTFGCDVFIDLMGYRKYGHNESDEPTFTQPLQYAIIHAKKSIREIYKERLIASKVLDTAKAEEDEKKFREDLGKILDTIKSKTSSKEERIVKSSKKHLQELLTPFETKVKKDVLLAVGQKLVEVPKDVNVHPKIQRLLKERQNALSQKPEEPSIDWGTAELLAYATLALEKVHVRLSGEDVRRGTFSHRHSLYVDQVSSKHYFPLSHLSKKQAPVDIFNSPLSEMGVMGFEFGYSLLYPNSLVLWEGQFGDFANGGQVIIDQYIASSEMKWGHATNVTLLLPHGYEGMGPEHSSARIERFLQMCAQENMIVTNVTTPAQFFHLLRRQGLRPRKKPLIVCTPKVLLRYSLCKSSLNAFIEGGFEEILDDPSPPSHPKRILFCSGKIYYGLLQEREKRKTEDVLIRIEQIYPFHEAKMKKILEKYKDVKESIWVQEEHENMGAWDFLRPHLQQIIAEKASLTYVGRGPAASTAAGSHTLHALQQKAMLETLYS